MKANFTIGEAFDLVLEEEEIYLRGTCNLEILNYELDARLLLLQFSIRDSNRILKVSFHGVERLAITPRDLGYPSSYDKIIEMIGYVDIDNYCNGENFFREPYGSSTSFCFFMNSRLSILILAREAIACVE